MVDETKLGLITGRLDFNPFLTSSLIRSSDLFAIVLLSSLFINETRCMLPQAEDNSSRSLDELDFSIAKKKNSVLYTESVDVTKKEPDQRGEVLERIITHNRNIQFP